MLWGALRSEPLMDGTPSIQNRNELSAVNSPEFTEAERWLAKMAASAESAAEFAAEVTPPHPRGPRPKLCSFPFLVCPHCALATPHRLRRTPKLVTKTTPE